jgi:uncharacterized protein YPO0396
MLEPFGVEDRINKVVAHVDDLTRAHEAVLKAKRQLDDLAPVIADGAEHDRLADELAGLESVHEAIPAHFAHLALQLLQTRQAELEVEHADCDAQVERDRVAVTELEARRTELITQRAQHGGDRLTILAASLAYQFDLEWGRQRSHTFQSVVIDEAFGRGSDDSTRFALKLFGALGMQVLIVTPLQKIQGIESYVSTVGLVDNPGGAGSRIQVLPIEEYHQRKDLHAVGGRVEDAGA